MNFEFEIIVFLWCTPSSEAKNKYIASWLENKFANNRSSSVGFALEVSEQKNIFLLLWFSWMKTKTNISCGRIYENEGWRIMMAIWLDQSSTEFYYSSLVILKVKNKNYAIITIIFLCDLHVFENVVFQFTYVCMYLTNLY